MHKEELSTLKMKGKWNVWNQGFCLTLDVLLDGMNEKMDC